MYTLRAHYYIGRDVATAMLWCIRADEGLDCALWDGAKFAPAPDCASLAEVQAEVARLLEQAEAEIERRRALAAQKPSDRDIEL